jgi:hypothetical protein
MTANYGNSQRKQRSIRSDGSRPATKDSESEAATPPADEKLRLVQAKTRTPIAPSSSNACRLNAARARIRVTPMRMRSSCS